MSRSKDTEAQIIGALKQVEAGRTVEDVTREIGLLSEDWLATANPLQGSVELA